MNERERFLRYMSFEKVDRIPLMEMGVWPETLERWHHEGLPKWVTCLRHLEDYLRLDRSFNVNWLEIEQGVFPPFERTVLEETETTEVIRDETGVVFRQHKSHRTIPQYIRFPVRNEADYEALLPRLNGKDPGRYAADFDEDLHWRRQRGEIVGLNFRAFFGFPRALMGLENWCMAFYDHPQLVRRIIADRVQFARDLLPRVLATGALDFVQVWEDMAYKAGPLLSPRLVRELMLPAYEELVQLLRAGGVRLIMVDCDGRVDQLLPIWLAAGIDGCHPCEIAAGSDPLELRRRFPGCRLIGGLDKRAIASGRDGVDAELRRIQPLLREGAYIPLLDHFVPPDVSYETYVYYVERRRELLANPGLRFHDPSRIYVAPPDELGRLLEALDTVRDPAVEACGRARIAAVYRGQEADCLPILFDAPAHDVAVASDLRQQFYSPNTMLIAHLKRLVATAAIPHDGQLCIRPNLGVVFVPSVFGLDPEVPADAMPRFRGHLAREEAAHLQLPEDITRSPLVARAIDYVRHFRETLGERVHVYMPDTQGVFDIAHLVLGDALFLELYDDPGFVHSLLDVCLGAYLRVTLALKAALGEPLRSGYHGHGMVSGLFMSRGGARVSEDTPTLLQPRHIDEFVVPYIRRALQPFDGGFVHYCGRNDHLFQALLSLPEVRGINLGNPEKHDPASYMQALLAHGKFYFGFWPRKPGEALRDYLQRMLDLTGGQRRGLIFLLTPNELGSDSPHEAVRLWRRLQGVE